MERDRQLEQELLERAKVPEDLADQVIARLDRYEAANGNTGWDRGVDDLLAEMEEEAADIAGWGIGAARQLDPVRLNRVVVAMALGAAAWREIRELRELLGAGDD